MSKLDKSKIKLPKNIFLGKGDPLIKEFDLIEVQKKSWKKFIEKDLKDILNEFFPIDDYTGKKFTLFFDDLYFDKPRYPLALCLQKNSLTIPQFI